MGRDEEVDKCQVGVEGTGGGRGGRVYRRGAPAEVAAREKEGRAMPKRDGCREEDERKTILIGQ
jgi:hypothetical protein